MNKLKGLNYNYEDVPEQDEYDSSLEEPWRNNASF